MVIADTVQSTDFAARRKKGGETQLTKEIRTLCERDPVLARGVALAVVKVAATGRPRALRDVVDHVPDAVVVRNEENIGPKKLRKIARFSKGGQLDLEFIGRAFCLVVEVKIGAKLGENQLERYLRHKGITNRNTAGGLVLLTRDRTPIPTRVAKSKHWLGQISWRELLPELEKVVPGDPAVRGEWKTVLDVIQQPGDLVADGVTWPLKGRTPGNRNRTILGAAKDGACEYVERTLAPQLHRRAEGLCAARQPGQRSRAVAVNGDRASLGLYIPATSKSPVVLVELWGKQQPLKVSTTVFLDQLSDGKAYTQQAQKLRAAKFTPVARAFVAADTIRQGPEKITPQQALQAVLEDRLGQIIRCGALNLTT